MPISYDKNSKLALVADIGGTQMRAGLVDTAGNVLKKEIALSEHVLGFELAKERLANLMLSVVGDTTVAGWGSPLPVQLYRKLENTGSHPAWGPGMAIPSSRSWRSDWDIR